MSTYYPAGGTTFSLQSSISSTQTTITLTSFNIQPTGDPITMAMMNTSIAYGTIAPKTSSSEFISFTGVTANADGTFTLTGVTRGLDKTYPFTEDTDFKLPHSGGSQFILSDAPQVFNKYGALVNDNTWSGLQTFGTQNAQTTAGNPTLDNEYARKAYVDSVATGGATFNRTVVTGTAGETIAVDQLIYLKVSDGRWWLCDADTASTVENVILGIAQGAGTAGNPITSGVLTQGLNTFSALTLTANTKYYASNTAGGFSSSAGTKNVSLGESQTTTTFLFYPRFDQQLTQDQINALAGTSGTPSSTNKYVTSDDVSSAAGSDKIVRASGTALPALDASNLLNLPGTKIATVYTDVSTSSNTTETTLVSTTVPANTLSTNNAVRVRLYFSSVSNTSVGTAWTLRFKYGATTVVTYAPQVAWSSVGAFVEFVLFASGATGTQEGNVYSQIGSTGPVITSGTSSIDSTSSQTLVVTSQFSNNSANDAMTMKCATVEKIV